MSKHDFSYCAEILENGDWVIAEYHADKWVRYLGLRFTSRVDASRFIEVNRLSTAGRALPDYLYDAYQLPEGNWVVAEYYKGKLSAHLGTCCETKEDVDKFLEYNGWPRRPQGGISHG